MMFPFDEMEIGAGPIEGLRRDVVGPTLFPFLAVRAVRWRTVHLREAPCVGARTVKDQASLQHVDWCL